MPAKRTKMSTTVAASAPPVDRSSRTVLTHATDAQKTLLDALDAINGQDAYSEINQALGKINRSDYLVLPTGFATPNVSASDVGKIMSMDQIPANIRAQIYALNKPNDLTPNEQVRFATLRLYSVLLGWVAGQSEIREADPPANAEDIYLTDLPEISNVVDDAKIAAMLVPLAAEHVFRTTGHHYLTGLAADYAQKYARIFGACLSSSIQNYLGPELLYHRVLHWITPRRSRAVLEYATEHSTTNVPAALQLRASALPAGTAIIGITTAVLDAFQSSGLLTEMKEESGLDLDKVYEESEKIKANPARYHKAYFAYQIAKPSEEDIANLNLALDVCQKLAPVSQGFIDAMFADAALGRAQALKKHSNTNPVLHRRALRYFKALSRKEIASVKEMYSGKLDASEGAV